MSARILSLALSTALALSACSANPSTNSGAGASPAPSISASGVSVGAVVPESDGHPLTIENCGLRITYDRAPEKAVTLNQGATEVMLALGLEDRMVGTAYLDDPEIDPQFAEVYKKIPVIAEKTPTLEQFLATGADFAYASYGGVFSDKYTKERTALLEDGIRTYVSEDDCRRGEKTAWDQVWLEIKDIANIFGVPDRAKQIVQSQEQDLKAIKKESPGKNAKTLWWDSKTDTPFVGGSAGGPQLIMDAVGLKNVFEDQQQNWFDTTWEAVAEADPDWIVVIDASWDPAEDKITYISNDPALKDMRAVKEKKFLKVPFSKTTPGVMLVDGAKQIAEQLRKADS